MDLNMCLEISIEDWDKYLEIRISDWRLELQICDRH